MQRKMAVPVLRREDTQIAIIGDEVCFLCLLENNFVCGNLKDFL